jgi:hypothetical protein
LSTYLIIVLADSRKDLLCPSAAEYNNDFIARQSTYNVTKKVGLTHYGLFYETPTGEKNEIHFASACNIDCNKTGKLRGGK